MQSIYGKPTPLSPGHNPRKRNKLLRREKSWKGTHDHSSLSCGKCGREEEEEVLLTAYNK